MPTISAVKRAHVTMNVNAAQNEQSPRLTTHGPSAVPTNFLVLAVPVISLPAFVVEEKIGEQNVRVFSEMRILGKIGFAIFDFCRVCRNLVKFGAKSDFRVWDLRKLLFQDEILGFRV